MSIKVVPPESIVGTEAVQYEAQCHCGALTARFSTSVKPSTWAMRACQCGFCRRHASLSVSDPRGSLVFRASSIDSLERYRFGTQETDFLLCRHCGVYMGARMSAIGRSFGVLNARTLLGLPQELPPPIAMFYADESLAMKWERREKLWTPLGSNSV